MVVKQGELEISSTAVVRVLTWKDDLLTEVQVPPDASIALILKNLSLFERLRESKVPPGDLRHAALAIERRWTVPDLHGQEILEALAQAYAVLSDLVLDAHSQMNRFDCVPAAQAHPDFRSSYNRSGILACMALGADGRTERIKLATGVRYHVETLTPPDAADLLDEAAKRYGLNQSDRIPTWQSDPLAIAEKVLYRAKQLLRKESGHARMMFIRDGQGRWHHSVLFAEDRTEKHILMRVAASFVERVGADALIEVAEAWTLAQTAVSELKNDLANIQYAPSRGEVLKVVVATREGLLRIYNTPFTRGVFGGIKLGNTEQSEDPRGVYYLTPVFEVWRRQGTRTREDGKTVRLLWEPDPLDTCFCGGAKRFVECCSPLLDRARSSYIGPEIDAAIANGRLGEAEQLARAALAQYVIWVKQHTAPSRHVADELHRDLLGLDIPALHASVNRLRSTLAATGHLDAYVPALRRLTNIVGVPEIALRVRALIIRALWEAGELADAVDELHRLGGLDDVHDSMALVLATKLLHLSDDAAVRSLRRATELSYSPREKTLNSLELARRLRHMGERDAALTAVDSAIADAESAEDGRELQAEALLARWEISDSDEDFHRARTSLEALPREEVWQELACLLIDHGDFDDAVAVLEPAIARGNVTARLMVIDTRLRSGNTDAARDVLSTIDPATIEPRLKFPYSYTVGLVALATNDPEQQPIAAALLREFSAFENAVFRPAKDLLAALERPDRAEGQSISDRLRGLVPFLNRR